MTTSRTGTATWKRISKQALRRAQAQGITHCPIPGCGVTLDYHNRKADNGASVDHIIAHHYGGPDSLDNAEVICLDCNRRKGKGWRTAPGAPVIDEPPFPTSRAW